MNNKKKKKNNRAKATDKDARRVIEEIQNHERRVRKTQREVVIRDKEIIQENGRNEVNKKARNKKKSNLTEKEIIRKSRRKKRFLACIILIFIILLIMFLISLFKWNKIIKDIVVCENSIVVDSTGNVIAVLGESRIQEVVPLESIPKNLINAYVAIEDKDFYKHHGINLKRTGGAILSYITHKGNAQYGGSTITQQLIKNVTGENESTISRKMTEWDRAIKTEMLLSKDQIMNTYLNIIYVGPNVYGVEMGAKYYFDKSASDLDLAECAFLAGLNHSPNTYNPFGDKDNDEKIKTRSKTVLEVMLAQKLISESEYNEAIAEVDKGLNFKKGNVKSKGDGIYSYMVDATIAEVIGDLEKDKKISTTFATNYLYFSGLKIYCTQNSDIQEDIENELSKTRYMIRSTKDADATAQSAMIVIDHMNGEVKGCVRWVR